MQLTGYYINYKVLGQLYFCIIHMHTYYTNIDDLCAHLDRGVIFEKNLT